MDASARGGLMMKFASLLKRDIEYLAVNFQYFWQKLFFKDFLIYRNWRHLITVNRIKRHSWILIIQLLALNTMPDGVTRLG